MFTNSIGLTGVESSYLPYHLSGILLYLTKFVFPIILVYFFYKSQKSLTLYIILLFYGFFLGLTQISKMSAINVIGPLILFSILQNRKFLSFFLLISAQFIIGIVSAIRSYVYVLDGKKIVASVDDGLIFKLLELFTDKGAGFNLLGILANFDRIESPQNIILAYQFNSNVVGGSFEMLKRFLYFGSGYDIDLFHIGWIGTTLLEGFVHSGGTFSTLFAVFINNPLYIILISFIVYIYIFTLEIMIRNILINIKLEYFYRYFVLVVSILFITSLGSNYFLFLYIFMFLTFLCGKFYEKKIYN
jgi:hypothetical protein